MRSIFLLGCAMFMAANLLAVEKPYDYVFFDNSRMAGNYFYSHAEYEGPSWVEHSAHKLPVSNVYFSPGNALELTYLSNAQGSWEAEIQYAPLRGNNFFKPAEVLSLNFASKEAIDVEALPQICIRYTDSTRTESVPLATYIKTSPSPDWHHVEIPLRDLGVSSIEIRERDLGLGTEEKALKYLGAVVFKPGKKDGKEHTLYIDDVEILPASHPTVSLAAPSLREAKGYERHIDIRWNVEKTDGIKYFKVYRSFDGTHYEPVGISRPWMLRYADFIGVTGKQAWYKVSEVDYALNESPLSEALSAGTREMTDDELLDMVQEANFRYYWEGAEPESGLARENIPGRTDMIACGASGFGIMTLITGIDRGFISREEGVDRFVRITSYLEKADRFHGAYAHFMNGTTGKAEPFFGGWDNGADLVETSFLFHGLLAARQYFDGKDKKEELIRKRIDTLWKNVEWSWFKKTKDSPYLYWHWSPDQTWVISHPLIGWNETMITYMLAIMSPTHAVAPEMYYSGWASQDTLAQNYRRWAVVPEGMKYYNGNTYYGRKLDVAVSNGGPLFFIHYSFLGLDPHKVTDRWTNYFENNRNIALINNRYCIENQGKYTGYGRDCWGITASDFAWDYAAREPMPHLDNGTIAPTGALASFPYTPEESMAALKNYYRNYGSFLWGEYGFRDAFNLTENWASSLYMGLNQGPIAVMIENYRSGLLWNLFMSHPDVQRGLKDLESIK